MDNQSEIINQLRSSISQPFQFSHTQCEILESLIQDTINFTNSSFYKHHTIDRGLLRTKYFFGERYTYGFQMHQKGPGMERLYPKGLVDPIPTWMYYSIIKPLIQANIIEENFINSAVINEYQEGGCIVSHIDPPHIFDRPIVSVNLNSDSALCFGCKFAFKPIRCTEPIYKLNLPRGIVTLLSGFGANEITHCVRPEDTTSYRTVIILRRILPNAPRLLLSEFALLQPKAVVHSISSCTSYGSNKMVELNENSFKKFYEKYSKTVKTKHNNNKGGISKPKKTFFADNKRYSNKPYCLEE